MLTLWSLALNSPSPAAPAPQAARERCTAQPRADIDGLRGVAVLSVLAVHCFPAWSTGGFIGIDIFFVLTGYLVTHLLLSPSPAGSDLLGFYAARVRRLAPALCFVLLACLAFSVVFASPSVARAVGRQVAWAVLFALDVLAWSDSTNLDLAASGNPLLHLWQLAVIAQFYLVWPVLWLVCMQRPSRLGWMIGGSLVASLAFNLTLVGDAHATVFFLPMGRWWELMAGALLARVLVSRESGGATWLQAAFGKWIAQPQAASDLMSWGGSALLLLAVALVGETTRVPGWWALMPVIGTVLLLAAGPQGWINRQVLAHPVLRFYGLISYPLFLWHWPLLCFPLVLGVPLKADARVLILLASVVLAALTYELVEKPIRSVGSSRQAAVLLAGALGVVGALGWVVLDTDGLMSTYPATMRSLGPWRPSNP